jgi:outer membrane receptor protein involved in Fe transport
LIAVRLPGAWPSALALLLALGAIAPANAFEAQVVRPDGSPLAGAEVAIVGRAGVARTDGEGRFSWQPDPVPPFEVIVVLPGGRVMRPILVAAIPGDGPLHLAVALLEENVTVTAGSAPGIEGSPASATAVLPAREFRVRQPANIAQVLENVAGVSQVSEGQAAVPAIRGLAKSRTLVLIDGARVSAERRVGPSATFLDPVTLESVEVSRGPATVAYGSDAFGGVINARTRSAEPGSGFGGRFVGTLGEGAPEKRAALELRQGFAKGGLLAQGHWREADDYDSPQGTVPNSGYRDYGFRARADRYAEKGVFSLAWQSDRGRDIERPRTNSEAVRFYYPAEDSHRVTASWEAAHALGFSRLGANAFFGTYAVVTDQDRHATASAPRSVERADVSSKDYLVRVFAQRPLGDTRLELGLDVNGRFGLEALEIRQVYALDGDSLTRDDTLVSIEDARRTDAAFYSSLEAALARALAVSGGLRVDYVTTRNAGGHFGDHSTSHTAGSGFLNLTAGSFAGVTANAQVSRGFRDPMLSDRYYRGPTGRGYITGNPGLDPETSLQLDAGLRYTATRWRAELHAYQYDFEDLIERYQTAPDFYFFRNRGEARIRGVELELHAELPGGWNASLSGHVVRGRSLDDETDLDDVPPETVTLQVTKSFGERGFVQARGALYASDERPGPTEEAREGYGLVDVSGGWRFLRNLEIRLLARNLLDEEYLVSPDSRAVLAAGRSVLVTASLDF